MAYQPIYLGTPNNNDGDSLYAGGAKINANFLEIYNGIAGGPNNPIRINLGSGQVSTPVTSQTLLWSVTQQAFIPSSSTMMLSLANNGSSGLILTNAQGRAGTDLEYQDYPNKLVLFLNGRPMWDIRSTTTGSVQLTRGTMVFGMGNPRTTALAISTRGVAIGGDQGLVVYRNAFEESAASSTVLSTGSSGVILYDTPLTSGYLPAADSSNAIANTGYVQAALRSKGYAFSSVSITGSGGLAGGGFLSSTQTVSLNPAAFSTFCNGLLYNYRENGYIQVEPGAASHYSFSVSGQTTISQTSVLAMVSLNTPRNRFWNVSATWLPTNNYACIDTIVSSTWYYLYLIANNTTGEADFVVTTSRDYAGIVFKLGTITAQYSVIRRLGAFRTNGTGSLTPEPFIVRRIDNSSIRIEYLSQGYGGISGYGSSLTTTSNSVGQVQTLINVLPAAGYAQGLFSSSIANTAVASLYSSVLVRWIPPLPGITAEMEIITQPATSMCTIAFFGDPWVSSTTNYWGYFASTARIVPAPMQMIRPLIPMVTSIETRILVVSPDVSQISDSVVGSSNIWTTSEGTIIRYASVQLATGNNGIQAPAFLGWNVKGFTIAR